jgi:hypothetical protein
MSIALVIPPIANRETIIIWDKIELLNMVRAIIFIVGIGFLPGANLYSLFLHKNKLFEKFGVESFFLKITLYPLFSFSFVGISVLILDQIGLARIFFEIALFLEVLTLFILDLIAQKLKKNFNFFKPQLINISVYSLIILIISLGIILIATGIQIGILYLIPGDSWIGLAPTNYIGSSKGSPIEWGRMWSHYPIFWSYISFGLSILCGLPYFNTNALLTPFCYLFITSVYLMMRAILYKLKQSYACFSTILISVFSTLFYISRDYKNGDAPGFIFDGEFLFFYKSLSYILLFISIALFIINSEVKKENDPQINLKYIFRAHRFIILGGLFLVLSFMLYMITLIMGFIIILLYLIFSHDKIKIFKFILQTLFYFNIFFISFDIIMNFYLSESALWSLNWFFNIKILSLITGVIPQYLLLYCHSHFVVHFFHILNLHA